MKKPKEILPHLFENPYPLLRQRCLNKLITLLPLKLKESVLYSYIRGSTLYFVLNHPGYVMEINYNKTLIKELLTLLQNRDKICKEIEVKQIKAYAKFTPPKQNIIKSQYRYKEKAKGDFLEARNFQELFHKIKEAIKKNAEP